jgi:hypothetical protein
MTPHSLTGGHRHFQETHFRFLLFQKMSACNQPSSEAKQSCYGNQLDVKTCFLRKRNYGQISNIQLVFKVE